MENFRRRSRYAAVFLVLILAFAAITVLNINSGNVNISIPEIFRILLRRTGEGKEYNIIWKIRLPRILMAAILGGALSLSGFLYRLSLKTRLPVRLFLEFPREPKWSWR